LSLELSIKDPGREQEMFVGRAITLFVFVVILFAVLVARMLTLQISEHETYQLRADNNRTQIQTLVPPRGMIYDRNGRLLADNQTSFSLAVVAERAEDVEGLLTSIIEILSLTPEQVERIRTVLNKPRRADSAAVILESLSEKQVALLAVNRHRLRGVEVVSHLVRSYPMGVLAAHAVGSVRRMSKEDLRTVEPVQYSGTQFIGKRGVEAFYEKSLHGKVGYQKVETDAYGRVHRVLDVQGAETGQNLTLHLDSKLQLASVEALGGRRGAIVALDPVTGGILAMVSQPSYDPNLFVSGMTSSQFDELAGSIYLPLFNRAVNGQYAPGSTFKPVVGLAGISMAVTNWEETIEDKGWFKLPGQERVYRDWSWTKDNSGGQGEVDLNRAIYRSSNVYFYDLASRMEIRGLLGFAGQFGFGKNLAIDIPEASSGLLPTPEWKRSAKNQPWYPGDSVNLGIGQGDLLATPLQMATVAATIANRGRVVRPRMLLSSDVSIDEMSRVEEPLPVVGLSEEDWESMVDSMEDVVHRGGKGFRGNGTAWAYIGQKIAYRMAGKSGTAQVVEINQGEVYDAEKLSEFRRKHAWFIAFAPVDNPTIAVAVLVENGGGGSSVAAPVAKAVIDAHLSKEIASIR
jgi:penicillin-binding protein 2|tara:strand:+ start:4693 stop:6582 length:1890 start_codon:yes stop_codon:yes gene_type:complete